jgi:hypothetical protein
MGRIDVLRATWATVMVASGLRESGAFSGYLLRESRIRYKLSEWHEPPGAKNSNARNTYGRIGQAAAR